MLRLVRLFDSELPEKLVSTVDCWTRNEDDGETTNAKATTETILRGLMRVCEVVLRMGLATTETAEHGAGAEVMTPWTDGDDAMEIAEDGDADEGNEADAVDRGGGVRVGLPRVQLLLPGRSERGCGR